MESIKARIAVLRKMTVQSGCTEAEALAAAAKAAELMRAHGLSEADLEIGEAAAKSGSRGRAARDPLWRAVAYCTNTIATFTDDAETGESVLVFIGREPGPQIAAYLVDVLNRALGTAIAAFKAGEFYRRRRTTTTRRAAVKDFTRGMVARLMNRLHDLFRDSIDRRATALARAAQEDRFGKTKAVCQNPKKTRFALAALQGHAAGARVNLAHGVDGGAPAPRAAIGTARRIGRSA